jgi:hypothetical protein
VPIGPAAEARGAECRRVGTAPARLCPPFANILLQSLQAPFFSMPSLTAIAAAKVGTGLLTVL